MMKPDGTNPPPLGEPPEDEPSEELEEEARSWHCRFLPELQKWAEDGTSNRIIYSGHWLRGKIKSLDLERGIIIVSSKWRGDVKLSLSAVDGVAEG